jgi:uncharacterized membrane protein
MINFPVRARVECVDGPGGQSVALIVNPTLRQVTHLVVEDKSAPDPVQRLVPVDQVVETTPDLIYLRCSLEQLAAMEPFTEMHYVKSEVPDVSYDPENYWVMPYATSMQTAVIPLEEERVPPGALSVHRAMDVEATDGHIGQVGEFLVDPESGAITHLVLLRAHLLGKEEVALPLSVIDHVDEETVYLKLDRQAVERLPDIPMKRNYGRAAGRSQVELIAQVFDDPEGASESLAFVRDLHHRKILRLINAAVLVRDEDGEFSVRESGDLDARQGRVLGAITGGLIGLLTGPIGAVVGALAGAGVGGIAAKRIDVGLSDKFLEEFRDRLQPGTSALVLVVQHEWVQKASEALADREGVTFQQTLSDELVDQLMDAGEEGSME